MYHYTECGLDNVWLVNGYHVEEIDGEEFVSFEDAEELHKTIGRSLANKRALNGVELRFLRKALGFSQRGLAELLGTTEQSVSLWERGAKVPTGEARLLKVLYLESVDGNIDVRETIARLVELDEKENEKLVFKDTAEGWKLAA